MNILITGGASGLGEAITRKLAADINNKVFFTYNNAVLPAKNLENEFQNVVSLKCDFKNAEDLEKLIERLTDFSIQVLINNAMTGFTKNHFHKIKTREFEDSFRFNVLPTIAITQAMIKHFRKAKFGKIITILSSAIVNIPPVGWSEYVANKAYLHALAKAWASENANFNITSNCISPEFMQTSLTDDTDQRIVETMIQNHPLKKLLTTNEVADVVSFLVNATQHLNGSNIIVNSATNVI
jgi:3-oxoacyl-[acyl-carrier protein] reductase